MLAQHHRTGTPQPCPPALELVVPAEPPGADDPDAAIAQAILRAYLADEAPRAGPAAPAPGADRKAGSSHVLAERRAWPWLPTLEHQHLAPHPYCEGCGGVKYVGSLRALPMGRLTELASRLRWVLTANGRKVSDAQLRLIVRRLEESGAYDGFVQSWPTQERLLLEAFAAYTGMDIATLATYLRST